MKTLFKNATLLPEYGFGSDRVEVVVTDSTVTEIARKASQDQFDEVIDCEGNLLMPAFYNVHCHAAMTLFRGYGEDLPLQRWLEEKIFPAEELLTPRSVYVATKLAIAEMLRNGIASFSDMYMFEDEVARAVLETGIKANLSRSLVSFDPNIDMTRDSRLAEALRLVHDFHGAGEGRLKIDLSLHAEYTNVPRACEYVGACAKEMGLGMQIHLSETEKEHFYGRL